MTKISYAYCLGLSPAVSAQFTLEMWVTPRNREKCTKTPILGVQGHSRSWMLTFLKSSSPALVMISSMSVPISNHFHARRANSSKITFFNGCPLFTPSFVEIPLTHRHEFLSRNTRDSRLSNGENPKPLSHLGFIQYWAVTDGLTKLP